MSCNPDKDARRIIWALLCRPTLSVRSRSRPQLGCFSARSFIPCSRRAGSGSEPASPRRKLRARRGYFRGVRREPAVVHGGAGACPCPEKAKPVGDGFRFRAGLGDRPMIISMNITVHSERVGIGGCGYRLTGADHCHVVRAAGAAERAG